MKRLLLCLGVLLGAALGQDLEPEEQERSPRAARLRKQALEVWERAAPVADALDQNRAPTPAEAVAAASQLEAAVALLEKALHLEWHAETNATLARAAQTWYALRAHLPAPAPPADAPGEKEAAREKEKQHRARVQEVRRFILEYGRARRFDEQFRTCRRCDGRQFVYDAFAKDRRACPVCDRQGRLPVREGIIRARWHFHSPLYRANAVSSRDVRNALSSASRAPERLAPFVRSVAIDRIEDHDLWMRVAVTEKTFSEPGSKKTVETEKTYHVYRVGKTWYLYFRRTDNKLIDIPEVR